MWGVSSWVTYRVGFFGCLVVFVCVVSLDGFFVVYFLVEVIGFSWISLVFF